MFVSQHRMRVKVEIGKIFITVQPCQIVEKCMQNAIFFVFLISFWAIEFSCWLYFLLHVFCLLEKQ